MHSTIVCRHMRVSVQACWRFRMLHLCGAPDELAGWHEPSSESCSTSSGAMVVIPKRQKLPHLRHESGCPTRLGFGTVMSSLGRLPVYGCHGDDGYIWGGKVRMSGRSDAYNTSCGINPGHGRNLECCLGRSNGVTC